MTKTPAKLTITADVSIDFANQLFERFGIAVFEDSKAEVFRAKHQESGAMISAGKVRILCDLVIENWFTLKPKLEHS